jgi:uncharacterized protein (TIRG00374 family)
MDRLLLVNDANSMGEPKLAAEAIPVGEIQQSPDTRAKTALRWALSLAIVGLLVFWATRAIDFRQFAAIVRASEWRLVALAGLVAVTFCMLACSLRLWLLVRPLPTPNAGVGFWQMTSIYLASSAAHHLLPAPAAEVLRTVHLKRRYGYTLGGLVASQVVEKVIDALGLGLEIGVVAAVATLPRMLGWSLWLFAFGGAGGALAVMVIGWRYRASAERDGHGLLHQLRGFLRTLHEGMYLLRSPRTWAASLACSFVNDFANAATVGLALAAVGLTLPISSWFVIVLVARLAGLLPSTPGQFGVVEAGLVLAMSALGVDHNRALAVAVLYHLAHFIPVTAIGLWELKRQWQAVS